MKVIFSATAWEDFTYFRKNDPKLFERLNELIENTRRTPFQGIGKPEPLKNNLSGLWSRRINREHRLVSRVAGKASNQALEIAQLRFHY